jgi:hypothetical protein
MSNIYSKLGYCNNGGRYVPIEKFSCPDHSDFNSLFPYTAGTNLLQQLIIIISCQKIPVYVDNAYRIADCYCKFTKEVFTQTGDLKAIEQNWLTANEWKKIILGRRNGNFSICPG